MITLYHGSNVQIADINLAQCNPYKDFPQLLIDREHYTLPQAVEAVYKSDIYAALLRPRTGLYAQSSGYVYQYLDKELKNR